VTGAWRRCLGRDALYRGVGTTSDCPPGTMIVLVPLPLLSNIPGTGEPGIMTD